MSGLLVGVPVLGRPANAAPLAANLRETTPDARVLFIASPGDDEELDAIDATGEDMLVVTWEPEHGDYARKINAAFRLAVEEGFDWFFQGADDLLFREGWYEACLAAHRVSGACVIGTRDLGNPRTMNGWHSTHSLIHRDYLECGTIDEKGIILHPGYSHEFVDDELVATARWRRTYSSSTAIVEHLHYDWGKAAWDPTYAKAQRDRGADMELFDSRKHMFGKGHAR